MSDDRIDILLATYNGMPYLPEQLASIEDQTHGNWHVIARDDGSADGTVEELKRFGERNPNRFTPLEDGDGQLGACMNFSRLLEASKSPYVAFCDQDDVWMTQKLEVSLGQLKPLERTHGTDCPIVVHCDLQVVNESLKTIHSSYWRYQNLNPKYTATSRMLVQNVTTGCGMLFNRSLAERASPISDGALMHDHWVGLIASAFGEIRHIDSTLVAYRHHDRNLKGAFGRGFRRWGHEWHQGFGSYKKKFQSVRRQAHALSQHHAPLPETCLEAAEALVDLSEMNPLGRRMKLFRHKILKQGLVRNMAMLLLLDFLADTGVE